MTPLLPLHRAPNTMKLLPFESADGLRFGAGYDEIRARLGQPGRRGTNAIDLLEWDYGHAVVRFDRTHAVVEITLRADVVEIGKIAVPRTSLPGYLRAQDPGTFTWSRFVVSPMLGLALDPEQPPWITFFARGELAQWQAGAQQESRSTQDPPR